MNTYLKHIIYFTLIILSTERILIPINEIANELMSRLRLQKYPQHFTFTINHKFKFNFRNISLIIQSCTPYYNDNNIIFNNTLVTYAFDINVDFTQLTNKIYYSYQHHFAQCKYDLVFIHKKGNSYAFLYIEKPDTFKVLNIPLGNLPQFKDVIIEVNQKLSEKLLCYLKKFIDKALETYPMDDCAYKMNKIIEMIVQFHQFTPVNIPFEFPSMITSLRINSITYKEYIKEEYLDECKIVDVAIDIDYYSGWDNANVNRVTMYASNIVLNWFTVSFTWVDTPVHIELAVYMEKQFENYSNKIY